MKNSLFLRLAVITAVFLSGTFMAFSESNRFDIGRLSFSMSPKILKDGSITDMALEYGYTDRIYGALRFRSTIIAENEALLDVADSLNAANENMYEVFLLPVEYYAFKTPEAEAWLGGGLYYQYSTLNEKGVFNMPLLETLTPPRERVNSYTNKVSMHLLGPLFEAGISYNAAWFNLSFSGGIVPVFFLSSSQNMGIEPLLPRSAEYAQNTGGSPYFYLGVDSVVFRYINLALLYDFAQLKYNVIDFDENLAWINPERTVVTQSFKIEASVLIPLGGAMRAQIGYGYTFDFTAIDTGSSVMGNRQYIILTAKKSGR
jgi:hypothetical protein